MIIIADDNKLSVKGLANNNHMDRRYIKTMLLNLRAKFNGGFYD